MSTLETRIAEVLAGHGQHDYRFNGGDWSDNCACGFKLFGIDYSPEYKVFPGMSYADCAFAAHQAAALAPVIAEAQTEASAQAFQAVRDNAEYEPEERDGPNLIIAAYLMIDVDKLNALDKSHDGMDWVHYTATDYGNELRKAQAEALREAVNALNEIVDSVAARGITNGLEWQTGALAMRDQLKIRADKLGTL